MLAQAGGEQLFGLALAVRLVLQGTAVGAIGGKLRLST
jgi:hypothetical protein